MRIDHNKAKYMDRVQLNSFFFQVTSLHDQLAMSAWVDGWEFRCFNFWSILKILCFNLCFNDR